MSEFRFNEEAGTLEGTDLPSIPEMIEAMKANGWKASRGTTWYSRGRCGCALGIAALVANRVLPSFSTLTSSGAMSALSLPPDIGWSIASGFDARPLLCASEGEELNDHAFRFGDAAWRAMNAAGLSVA